MNRRFDDTFFGKLVNAWPIILSVIAVIVSFAIMQTTLMEHGESLKTNLIEHKDVMNRLARLETISDMIPEMRNDIKRLLVRRDE